MGRLWNRPKWIREESGKSGQKWLEKSDHLVRQTVWNIDLMASWKESLPRNRRSDDCHFLVDLNSVPKLILRFNSIDEFF